MPAGGAYVPPCQECGMKITDAGEYHPYLFCALYKAGVTNPALFLHQSGWVRASEPSGGSDA